MDNVFVTLPENFIAITKYPGYFYNLSNKRLYSIKSGQLTALYHNKATQWNHMQSSYYVCINGARKIVYDTTLLKLVATNTTIPER